MEWFQDGIFGVARTTFQLTRSRNLKTMSAECAHGIEVSGGEGKAEMLIKVARTTFKHSIE